MRKEELKKAAERAAIAHINYLVKMAGGNVWGWKKTEKALKALTERMYKNPDQYGIK